MKYTHFVFVKRWGMEHALSKTKKKIWEYAFRNVVKKIVIHRIGGKGMLRNPNRGCGN